MRRLTVFILALTLFSSCHKMTMKVVYNRMNPKNHPRRALLVDIPDLREIKDSLYAQLNFARQNPDIYNKMCQDYFKDTINRCGGYTPEPTLEVDYELERLAQEKSMNMALYNYIDHKNRFNNYIGYYVSYLGGRKESYEGGQVIRRGLRHGFSRIRSNAGHMESLSGGGYFISETFNTRQEGLLDAIMCFVDCPGHRPHMLNKNRNQSGDSYKYKDTHVGIGIVAYSDPKKPGFTELKITVIILEKKIRE